jgi:hypothetical protein
MDGLVTMMMPGIVKSLSPGIAKADLSMKQGSLFCFVLFVRLRSLKPMTLHVGLLVFLESSRCVAQGCIRLDFETVWSYSVEAIDY